MVTRQTDVDLVLLERFVREIKEEAPHVVDEGEETRVVNCTPLLDLTETLIECGRTQYGIDICGKDCRVYGKLESKIAGGSIKVRPAIQMIEDAITSGRLRRRTTVFEATSGNFGIALGLMRSLDLDVVALVSRKLQRGVLRELGRAGVKTLNLDIDICPAPGVGANPGEIAARAVASSLRSQLADYGFDTIVFDDSRGEIERLLARQDAPGLAKLLARIYGGFCPQQYENELNVTAHERVTGPEIEQQLQAFRDSLAEFDVVCTFGTGGTSAGLSRYVYDRYGRRGVHVVFPLDDQDVAGIRGRGKAFGLKFYEPEKYAGEHEVDFEASRRALDFFVTQGYDMGESSALAIYATLQMINYGTGRRFVVILADGIQKYRENGTEPEAERDFGVTAEEASSSPAEFGGVLWTHPVFVPSERGIELLASKLGFEKRQIRVADTGDVASLYLRGETTDGLRSLAPNDGRKLLLVCVNGKTSQKLARVLSREGTSVTYLKGGIAALSANHGGDASELIELGKA